MCCKVSVPGGRILPGQFAEAGNVIGKALEFRVDDGIRPVGGHDAPVPVAVTDRLVVFEFIERRLGGCQQFDVEAVEQRARPELVLLQGLVDRVEQLVGIVRRQRLSEAKHFVKNMVQPAARRRAAKQGVAIREGSPDLALVGFNVCPVDRWNPECLHRDTLAVEHAHQVMVRNQQEIDGVRERLVQGEPRRIRVPVWADDREIRNAGV